MTQKNKIFWRLTEEEIKDIDNLKKLFNIKTRTKLLKHLVKLAKKKYL